MAWDDYDEMYKQDTKLADLNAIEPTSVFVEATSSVYPYTTNVLDSIRNLDVNGNPGNILPTNLQLNNSTGEIIGKLNPAPIEDTEFSEMDDYETYKPFTVKAYDEGTDYLDPDLYTLREFAFYIPDVFTYNTSPN